MASTVLFGALASPTPAGAVVTCALNPPDVPPSPGRISINANDSIDCENTEERTAVDTGGNTRAIFLRTNGANRPIELDTEGPLTATNTGVGAGNAMGVYARTQGVNGHITINSRGEIDVTSNTRVGRGIEAVIRRSGSRISITNTGDIDVIAQRAAVGVRGADLDNDLSPDDNHIEINQNSAVNLQSTTRSAVGVRAVLRGNSNSSIDVNVGGSIVATGARDAYGIHARIVDLDGMPPISGTNNDISIGADANFQVTSTGVGGNNRKAIGIYAYAETDTTPISITTTGGSITVLANGNNGDAYGIFTRTNLDDSSITITTLRVSKPERRMTRPRVSMPIRRATIPVSRSPIALRSFRSRVMTAMLSTPSRLATGVQF